MKSVLSESSRKFNPINLCKYLTRSPGGVVYVDRLRAIKTGDDSCYFAVTMREDYGWDYSDCKSSTVYFQAKEKVILGGIYNIKTGVKTMPRVVVAEKGDELSQAYICSGDVIEQLRKMIEMV